MNYYEHHLGDYAAATAHLSWDEDMAYRRLIAAYYHHERPIPADLKAAARLVRATSATQRQAVECVLQEFFTLEDDGWHQGRCDREIARYREMQPDREAKRDNERERQRRTRERRKQLFETLREHGVVPAYDAPMSELQAIASQVLSRDTSRNVTQPVTRDATATHTHTHTHTQTPNPITKKQGRAPVFEETRPPAFDPSDIDNPNRNDGGGGGIDPPEPTAAGRICRAMRAEGLSDGNPQDLKLLELIRQGATEAEFRDAARKAKKAGKGWSWALGAVVGARRDAAAVQLAPLPQADPDAWQQSWDGIVNRGANLGLPAWNEVDAHLGRGPSRAAYKRKVIEAAQRQEQAA